MVSLCQISRESRGAMGYITRCSESREDSINIYSWIYSSPGHNCKVENFSFSCVLSLTEACLPNVGTALCSFLNLCPFYSWCRESLQHRLQTTLLLFFFFFFQIKKSLNWHVFHLNRKSFFYIVWYLSSAFLILLYRGGDSSMAILFDFFVCGGGILKY